MAPPTVLGPIEARNAIAGNTFLGATTINCSGDTGSSPHPEAHRAIHFPPNDDFVQRSAILEQISRLLPSRAGNQDAALWGLGGSGKTQIALHYAYSRCSDPACSVFWVHADNKTSFAQDYKTVAHKLGLDGALEGEKLLAAVRLQIETLPQWVLVLDNADDLALFGVGRGPSAAESGLNLSAYVPHSTAGTVLWTSRDKNIAGSLVTARRGIHVARMTESESKTLFEAVKDLEAEQDEAEDILRLLAELEWLPLAISQAAIYIRRTRSSVAIYLGKIKERKKRWKILQKSEYDRHRRPQASNSVLETWDISVDLIRQENAVAYHILNVLAFVDSQNITFQMIAKAAQIINRDGRTKYGDTDEIRITGKDGDNSVTDDSSSSTSDSDNQDNEEEILDAVIRLEEFSFLTPRVKGQVQDRAYDMHKLVQEAVSYSLHMQKGRQSEEVRSAEIAFQVADTLFPEIWERETWSTCDTYILHAQRAGEWARVYNREVSVYKLLSKVSDYLNDRARWGEKEPVVVLAVNLRKKVLGEKHPDTVWSMADLAMTYHAQGRYNEAKEMKIEVLQLQRDVLGEKHPDTIRSMVTLATTYHAQGKYNEAEEIYKETSQLRRDVLGEKLLQSGVTRCGRVLRNAMPMASLAREVSQEVLNGVV